MAEIHSRIRVQYFRGVSVRSETPENSIIATGGSMVPQEEMEHYYQTGKQK